MDRATRRLFLVAFIGVVILTGVVAVLLSSTTMRDPDAAPGTSSVVGVVVGVDAETLGDVRSFDLRLPDGSVQTFGLGELENGDEFPPGHLGEHQVTAEPVRVWYREVTGGREAVRLEDAER